VKRVPVDGCFAEETDRLAGTDLKGGP